MTRKCIAGMAGTAIAALIMFGNVPVSAVDTAPTPTPAKVVSTKDRVRSITLDHVEFQEASISAVVDYLKARCKQLDPDRKGVNFLLIPEGVKADVPIVTLTVDDMPLEEFLRMFCMVANLEYRIEEHAVVIKAKPPKTQGK